MRKSVRTVALTALVALVSTIALPVFTPSSAAAFQVGIGLITSFDNDLGDWVARDSQGSPTLSISPDAFAGTGAALVADRTGQGDGIGYDVTAVMPADTTFEISAWVKMAEGSGRGDIALTMQRTAAGVVAFDSIAQANGVRSTGWTQITGIYPMPARDAAFLYFETAFPDGTSDDFLVDEVTVKVVETPVVPDLLPIKDTVDFNMGVAIDSRETFGPAGALVARHFDQMTPENHMKPYAWYDSARNFGIHSDAAAIMDFAQANHSAVYGHTLVWHLQSPSWFFDRDDGTPLTNNESDKQFLRDRMRAHIFSVAETLSSQYGLFGSDTNPLTAFDVVNEVISDGVGGDNGLRESTYYEILGEEYIDLAFIYADEAFNTTYAATGVDRPVLLAINDYSTERGSKRAPYLALVERLLARGVPVDIVGHQFHVNLRVSISALDQALDAFADLPVLQVVSELDVPTGVPVTEALLIEQGNYYRDAFRLFRDRADQLYSVSVWGLTDNRSWLADRGDPLIFDASYQAKPAYFGIIDGDLPAPPLSAFVFRSDAELTIESPEWAQLPLRPVGDDASFQLRWNDAGLVAYVESTDSVVDGTDAITFTVADDTYVVNRDGSGGLGAELVETDDGWSAVALLPLGGLTEATVVSFNIGVVDGVSTATWNVAGELGSLTLIENVSYTEAVRTADTPVIDGIIDVSWNAANTVATDTIVEGDADGATAAVATLWGGDTLYVLAVVTDSTPDVSASDLYQQDSVEIFLDLGNTKNGAYLSDDAQIRISAENVVSFGAGNSNADRIDSATTYTDTGYVVEASITLLGVGRKGAFQGADFQVNDGEAGTRTSVRTWAEPTGTGYLTNARWGVVQLVGSADAPTPVCDDPIEGSVLQTTCSALEALYTETGGDAWLDNAGWLSPTDPCTWFGVTCRGGLVNKITLRNNNLTGSLPSEIGDLTNLRVLDVNGNNLTGPIPPGLGSMTSLERLYLNSNGFSGVIPAELGDLDNLQRLYLQANDLSGAIPAELGDLSSVLRLYLQSNNLSGPIPAELGSLTTLELFYADSNQLSGAIPGQLGDLGALKRLYLNSNAFSGVIPAELGNLDNLQRLYLQANDLSGAIPAELGDLSSVLRLYLQSNNLSGPIPAELGSLTTLEFFYAYSNQLSGAIPGQLGDLGALKKLYLDDNDLSGVMPPGLGSMTSLQRLYLQANSLSGAIPAELGQLASLERLFVHSNDLSGALPAELGDLASLEHFYAHENGLTAEIPGELGNLSALKRLYLFDNELSGAIPGALGDLSNLTRMDLSNNQLAGELPAEFADLAVIDHLFLKNNNLTGDLTTPLQGLIDTVLVFSIADGAGGNDCLTASADITLWLDDKSPGWERCDNP